jgi:hypothetical protein
MRRTAAIIAALAIGITAAAAQSKKQQPPAKAPSGPVVRYLELFAGMLGELPSEGSLRETRSGATLTAAELDLCFSASESSSRKDRFVVALTPSAGKLTGSGTTQEDKLPVSVQLTRKVTGEEIALEGSIKVGTIEYKVASTENRPISEQQFRENQPEEAELVAEPADFTELSPGVINLRIKRDALSGLIQVLRMSGASVSIDSLLASCAELRSGNQLIRIEASPDKAVDLMGKLKAVPGVVATGWGAGYEMGNAVRLDAAPWRGGNYIDRKKFSSAASASIAKTLTATAQSAEWDDGNGELKLKLKRPNTTFRGFGFTDSIEIVLFAGPEKLKANEAFIVWIAKTEIEVIDEGPAPRLKLLAPVSEEGSSSGTDSVEIAPLAAALARDLNGQTWDSDRSAWRK